MSSSDQELHLASAPKPGVSYSEFGCFLTGLPNSNVTHTDGIAGIRCSPAFVCLSVCFSARYVKNRCSYDHQTWHKNVPPWFLEIHLFWGQKVKGQDQEAQKIVPAWVGECWLLVNFRRCNCPHCETLGKNGLTVKLTAGVLLTMTLQSGRRVTRRRCRGWWMRPDRRRTRIRSVWTCSWKCSTCRAGSTVFSTRRSRARTCRSSTSSCRATRRCCATRASTTRRPYETTARWVPTSSVKMATPGYSMSPANFSAAQVQSSCNCLE